MVVAAAKGKPGKRTQITEKMPEALFAIIRDGLQAGLTA
jgi:hypothetical protein